MHVTITGAAGWLGRLLTVELAEQGHTLTLIDNVDPSEATVFDPASPTGRSVSPLATDWPYVRGDILDPDTLGTALADADAVVHLAAWPTGDWDRAAATMKVNVLGTFNVYEAAVRTGTRRVVNASSINAYGSFFWRVRAESPLRDRLPLTEDEPRVPEDPYSLSKAMTEDIGFTFRRAHGTEAINLRFAGVWPTSRYEQVITEGLPPTEAWADDLFQWVHPADVIQGIRLACTAPDPGSNPMVLAAADTRAPEPTLELIRRFRPELEPRIREPLPGRASLLSITRARQFLGYAPTHALT